jgi:hypothetical protein
MQQYTARDFNAAAYREAYVQVARLMGLDVVKDVVLCPTDRLPEYERRLHAAVKRK